MKFQQILAALYKTPLSITPEYFETLDAMLRPRLLKGERPTKDFWGEPLDVKMEVASGTAVIPVFGPLLNHASLLEKQCGATSYEDLRQDLQNAGNMGVKQIVFNFDSPGGQTCGCLELAELIADFQQENGIPCYAFTDAQCCSAAYMLASSCDQIFCTRTSMVGSIGCILGFLDVSKAYEMEGLKAVIFSSGKYKATGADGTTLTEEQAIYLQGLVDSSFAQFAGHVLEHRPEMDLDLMQGQIFHGDVAAQNGVADDTCDSLEDLLEFLEPGD
jgi:signal peptide peptidase SppA